MSQSRLRRTLVTITASLALVPVSLPYAQAEIIDTPAALGATTHDAQLQRDAQLEKVEQTLHRADVAAQLEQLGVSAEQVAERVDALTDAELQAFATRLDQAPAGGDGFALIGLVFVVLIILELVGITDIFKKL
jgi:hypothetical protein